MQHEEIGISDFPLCFMVHTYFIILSTRFYNVVYMATTTVLAAAAAYGMFETARGSYYIMTASRRRARVSLS